MKKFAPVLACLLFVLLFAGLVQAQQDTTPVLSIQGILRKTNGIAVPDNDYQITFRLYEQEMGPIGNAIWTEVQDAVEVTNGIYSTTLGKKVPLTAKFNKPYFLGVSIGGSSEMFPRTPLSTAPYALALRGVKNTFPSTGEIVGDSATLGKLAVGTDFPTTHTVVALGGYLARGKTTGPSATDGTPGANGTNNNGYAFTNDKDSGLFSTDEGKVALYTDNQERLLVTDDNVQINKPLNVEGDVSVTGDVNAEGNINMNINKSVMHNDVPGWRLIDFDDFANGDEDWGAYKGFTSATEAQFKRDFIPYGNPGGFGDTWVAYNFEQDPAYILRKYVDLTGIGHSYVKVVFTYHFFDSWNNTQGFAGFMNAITPGNKFVPAWTMRYDQTWGSFQSLLPDTAGGESDQDSRQRVEMIIKHNSNHGNGLYICVGSGLGNVFSDEGFAISDVEIWVR